MSRTAVKDDEFHNLVHQHYDRIFRAARFMCNGQQAAEDLVHDTFLAAAESWKRFQGRSSTYTWLYGIMLNKFRRSMRKRSTKVISLQQRADEDALSIGDMLESDNPLPQDDIERRETIRHVRAAVLELPAEHRSVIALRFVEGLSYQEIGEALGCPLGTVKSRIHYALEKIGARLKDIDGPPT